MTGPHPITIRPVPRATCVDCRHHGKRYDDHIRDMILHECDVRVRPDTRIDPVTGETVSQWPWMCCAARNPDGMCPDFDHV